MSTPRFRYCVYGVGIVSDGPLALPEYDDGGLGEVEYRNATASRICGSGITNVWPYRSLNFMAMSRVISTCCF